MSTVLNILALGAILVGVGMVSIPAALVVFGLLLLLLSEISGVKKEGD